MKQSTMEILCCPLCKGGLLLKTEVERNETISEGRPVCSNCGSHYSICDGIPRMYIPDSEIIASSDITRFSGFIITTNNLDAWIGNCKTRKATSPVTNRIVTKFLVVSGWILLFSSILILSSSYINSNVMNSKASLLLVYLLISVSVTLFVLDYLRYRSRAKSLYLTNLRILKKLSDKRRLSEYDIRTHTEDREDDFESEFENQKEFVFHKSKRIASILSNYDTSGKDVLNVGCGGALHRSISEAYFEEGCDMIGVDISEEYLRQFKQIFDTDTVQANSMALPFKSNSFDLVNFTDIVEHLHHPLLGLSEAQRVLKVGGLIILTTDNHSTFSLRCINPIVFLEKTVSIYYDSILPPRKIVGQWMDFCHYHTEFSKKEITKLINAAGFQILSLKTEFPNKDKVNRYLTKIPILRFMGSQFIIIGKNVTMGSHVEV